MGLLKEFKEFAVKGNVLDLAIGVVIGGAFNKIVTALVESVLMPLVGLLIGNPDQFSSWELGGIKIGLLLQSIIDFIIIAFVLFLVLKAVNKFRKNTVAPKALPTPSEVLLQEIRDELRKK
jgi:large conductance mechanosensitive channel